MFLKHIISSLNEQLIEELLIKRDPKNLDCKVVDSISMVIMVPIIYFVKDLDFLYGVIVSVVILFGLNRLLRFWYRSYIEVFILINLDTIQISDDLKAQIKTIYGEYKSK